MIATIIYVCTNSETYSLGDDKWVSDIIYLDMPHILDGRNIKFINKVNINFNYRETIICHDQIINPTQTTSPEQTNNADYYKNYTQTFV